MSSQTEQAAKASTNAVQQGGLCGIERAKGDASETARPSQAHKDQAVETYDGLTSSGKVRRSTIWFDLLFSNILYRTSSTLCRSRSQRQRTTFKHRRPQKSTVRRLRDNTILKRPKPRVRHTGTKLRRSQGRPLEQPRFVVTRSY